MDPWRHSRTLFGLLLSSGNLHKWQSSLSDRIQAARWKTRRSCYTFTDIGDPYSNPLNFSKIRLVCRPTFRLIWLLTLEHFVSGTLTMNLRVYVFYIIIRKISPNQIHGTLFSTFFRLHLKLKQNTAYFIDFIECVATIFESKYSWSDFFPLQS